MSSFTKLSYHIIFSTKHRNPLIQNEFKERLYEYVGGIIRSHNGRLLEIGGIEDHIHLLVGLSPKEAVSDVIREIKGSSSKWSNETFNLNKRFEWQKGYGAFSVSYSQIDLVRHYIKNQPEHHSTKTFEEEYMTFLKLHDISFERKYLFEEEHCG